MPAVSLEEAKRHLDMWLEAEAAIASGQSYKIGTRSLTRADLEAVAKRIDYWRHEVNRLERGGSGMRAFRVVPRDL